MNSLSLAVSLLLEGFPLQMRLAVSVGAAV